MRVERDGVEAWFSLDPEALLGDDAARYVKVPDTLDVWFDSGVTHACVLDRRAALGRPADLYLEGSDQHRGWFQSSLLTSVAMTDAAPYRAVLTHGFTVDAEGRKMSKSLGNVVRPQDVLKTMGADIIRLWVAATDYRGEISVSDEILKRTADAYRRIRNTARYLLSNLADFDPQKHLVAREDMLPLDRWAVDTAARLQSQIVEAYTDYQFHQIYQKVHNFCVTDLGGFYLDVTKDRQYTCQPDSVARRSCQTAMYHIAEALVRWLAPVLSFTAEEIWRHLPGERGNSVFLAVWYDGLFALDKDAATNHEDWDRLTAIRAEVSRHLEQARKAGAIRSSLDAEVALYCDADLLRTLNTIGDELRFLLITSEARSHPADEAPEDVSVTDLDGLRLTVSPSAATKCVRCWHHRPDVGVDAGHPELCGRCVENVEGAGESRRFA